MSAPIARLPMAPIDLWRACSLPAQHALRFSRHFYPCELLDFISAELMCGVQNFGNDRQRDRLAEMTVKPSFLRAGEVFLTPHPVTAASCMSAVPDVARDRRAASYPVMSGMPMSRKAISG